MAIERERNEWPARDIAKSRTRINAQIQLTFRFAIPTTIRSDHQSAADPDVNHRVCHLYHIFVFSNEQLKVRRYRESVWYSRKLFYITGIDGCSVTTEQDR